jgi:transposase
MNKSIEQCPNCRVLADMLAATQAELQRSLELLAAAKKDSATSSKPPSSDIVKPQLPDLPDDAKRSIGGQPGHPIHLRDPFSINPTTPPMMHLLKACPCCGGELEDSPSAPLVVQQVDLSPIKLTNEIHIAPRYWCNHCQKACHAPMPLTIERGGLVGPRLTALIAFMKGCCHASYSTIRVFLRDVAGVTIARSTLFNTIEKVSKALDGPYNELLELLPSQDNINIDETGHKNNKQRMWTWCFRAELYTLYKIDAHRSSDVLMEVLGKEFKGTIGCDYFSAYRKYMRVCGVEVQFCLAHLVRDIKFLTTLPDAATKAYGEKLRLALKRLFEVFHRRDGMSLTAFDTELQAARDAVLEAGVSDVPATRRAQNMAKRFRKHGASFFTFVTTPGVEPTNNLAEQAIRFVVIDRLITQGTRSESGQRWCERIWTVIATCAGQGRSVYDYLGECVGRWFSDLDSPSLIPRETAA